MTEFNFVPQQQIRDYWPLIRPGLDEIKTKSPENWIVEDVYVDLFNQKSMMWIALKNKQFAGFFVLQPLGHELHIWAAWTVENDYQVVEKGLQFIKNMAKNTNARFVTFSSHRRGWERRAATIGFRPRKWICEV
jgi:hypothetical protein